VGFAALTSAHTPPISSLDPYRRLIREASVRALTFLSLAATPETMSALTDVVDGIVHEPTQVREDAVALTVNEIYEIHGPGRVDFGGGELTDADLVPHSRTWRDQGDDYQWWHLEAGTYLLEYSESLTGPAVLQARGEILERGGSHPTLHVTELPRVPLTVGGAGLRLKENARVSTLLSR
jgi:hypothetical protein